MKKVTLLTLAIMFGFLNMMAQSDHEPGYQAHDGFFLSMSVGPGWVYINDDITNGPYDNMKMTGVGGMQESLSGISFGVSFNATFN